MTALCRPLFFPVFPVALYLRTFPTLVILCKVRMASVSKYFPFSIPFFQQFKYLIQFSRLLPIEV